MGSAPVTMPITETYDALQKGLVDGVLLPFEADLDPLFDPAIDNEALVNWQNGIYDVKFAIDYTTSGAG